MKEFWNERYQLEEYIYGIQPNEFVKQFIDQQSESGKALFTAEGEGRNAVYAASKGWEVKAFDFSEAAKAKALGLADQFNVSLDYEVCGIETFDFPIDSYDLIVICYNHFPPSLRTYLHKKAIQSLRPEGKLILEVFSKKQLGNTSGGPKNPDLLYDEALLKNDFAQLNIQYLEELQVELAEGRFHKGLAEVVRMVAEK